MDGIAVGIGHHYIHKHSVDRGFERQLGRVRGLADLSGFGALLSREGKADADDQPDKNG
jgi:hypothetical protein